MSKEQKTSGECTFFGADDTNLKFAFVTYDLVDEEGYTYSIRPSSSECFWIVPGTMKENRCLE